MIVSCLQSPVLGLHFTSGETETPPNEEGSSQALPSLGLHGLKEGEEQHRIAPAGGAALGALPMS